METPLEDNDETLRKKFLFRLLYALHNAGNFGFRTEKYISRVSLEYNLYSTCAIYPRSASIYFQGSNNLNPSSSESYTFFLDGGWNFYKLRLLDELCFDIYNRHLSFEVAIHRLESIENVQPYPWYVTCLCFALASFGATTSFFGGNWRDGGFSFLYGAIVYLLDNMCTRFQGLAEISPFLISFFLAILSSTFDRFLFDKKLCLYGQLFGGVVWLLPGITITLSLIELYSKSIMFGATKLLYSITVASQIGFGLTLGYQIVYQSNSIPYSFENGCSNSLPIEYNFFLLPMTTMALGVMMEGDKSQLVGIIACGCVANFFSVLFGNLGAGADAVPFLSAIIVTAVARIYGHFRNQRPLVYIISGLLVLVPGGVGVRGMSSMWTNAQSGLEFTTKMLVIGVCLAIGVFISLVPSTKWLRPISLTTKVGSAWLTNHHMLNYHKKIDYEEIGDHIRRDVTQFKSQASNMVHMHMLGGGENPLHSNITAVDIDACKSPSSSKPHLDVRSMSFDVEMTENLRRV